MSATKLNPSSNTNDLQEKIIETIKHISEIKKFNIKDKFIQDKLNQISEQEIKLKNFAQDYNLRMNTHADDLILFANSCEEDNLNGDELLKSLRKFKINENKSELLNQIKSIKDSLNKIFNEIADYNESITKGETESANKINKVEEDKDMAISLTRIGVMIVGVGTIAATAAVPFTAGASLMALPAGLVAKLAASCIFQGTATATVSAAVAGVSSIYSKVLNNELNVVKEQISQLLQKLQEILEDVKEIIPHCESHFKRQSTEIEEVEEIMDVIKKFDDNRLFKPIAKTISNRARKNSEGYNASDIRQAFKLLPKSDVATNK